MNHNRKRLLLLSFVLILFLALFYSKDLIQKNMTPKTVTLFSLTNENSSQFLLTGESLSQKLIKNGSKWFVEKEGKQFTADPEKVSNLIQTLNGLTEGTIVSKNKNKHADFGIGTEIVVVKTPERERTLYLGKPYGSSARYARMDKQEEVFVGDNLQSILINSDFRDLKTHALDDDSSLQSMEIDMNGVKTQLTKSKDEWSMGNKKTKSGTVSYYINDLKNLTATDIVEANTKVTDTNPALTIRLKTQKQENTIDFVKYDDKSYAMKSSSYPWLFLIPEVNVASLQKQEKDFLE
ncbi:DUF4340 domain-containing protein [Candidatus Roizmanbacteria bacterium]|nr:DUF4340 domain-containing protein [Candidatus Roizmanbacteria bacterium]